MQTRLGLSAGETRELASLADQEAAEAVSLYQFTGLINENFTPDQKIQVVEMLWQVAYAEISITDTLWPDFRRADLFRAIIEYQGRQRRFGGLGDRSDAPAVEAEPDSRRA